MRSLFLASFILIILSTNLFSKQLIVGENEKYQSIQSAAIDAAAGDTILVKAGKYSGGMYIEGLKGDEFNYIHIIGETNQDVIIQGGNNAIQFSNPEFLIIENLIFEKQTGNGLNIDDGGDFSSPAINVKIRKCTFRDMDANGNNDLLKLSGLDFFAIDSCIFQNGADGGSGIDMVGCHNGLITHNEFTNLGSNAIQAKGGTQFIEISANFFENCGQRTLNLGGSTGLDFFRPSNAQFEAADLQVFSNIIIGSLAPICYVGSVRVEVVNNTIIHPEKWVIRILQETVDENRFEKCGNNTFANNLIYLGNLNIETNIGPNTSPQSFAFNNNFWFNYQNSNWNGPQIPVADPNQVINVSPEFVNFNENNFRLKEGSPAIWLINCNNQPFTDFYGNEFRNPRSAGAIEFENNSSIIDNYINEEFLVFPNPASEYFEINVGRCATLFKCGTSEIKIYNTFGESVISDVAHFQSVPHISRMNIEHLPVGLYFIQIGNYTERLLVVR